MSVSVTESTSSPKRLPRELARRSSSSNKEDSFRSSCLKLPLSSPSSHSSQPPSESRPAFWLYHRRDLRPMSPPSMSEFSPTLDRGTFSFGCDSVALVHRFRMSLSGLDLSEPWLPKDACGPHTAREAKGRGELGRRGRAGWSRRLGSGLVGSCPGAKGEGENSQGLRLDPGWGLPGGGGPGRVLTLKGFSSMVLPQRTQSPQASGRGARGHAPGAGRGRSRSRMVLPVSRGRVQSTAPHARCHSLSPVPTAPYLC